MGEPPLHGTPEGRNHPPRGPSWLHLLPALRGCPLSPTLCPASHLGLEELEMKTSSLISEAEAALAPWVLGVMQGREAEGILVCTLLPGNPLRARGLYTRGPLVLSNPEKKTAWWEEGASLFMSPAWSNLSKAACVSVNPSTFCHFNLNIRNTDVFEIFIDFFREEDPRFPPLLRKENYFSLYKKKIAAYFREFLSSNISILKESLM